MRKLSITKCKEVSAKMSKAERLNNALTVALDKIERMPKNLKGDMGYVLMSELENAGFQISWRKGMKKN